MTAPAPTPGTPSQPDAAPPVRSRYEALSHELHDSVAQQLGFLALQALRVEKMLDAHPQAQAMVEEMRLVLSRVQKQVREMITGVRTTLLEVSLREALQGAVEEFSCRSSMVFDLDNRLPDGVLSPACELQVLQIVRESLANAVRHSQAAQVGIRLCLDAEGQQVDVTISDNGVGITPAGPQPCGGHYGLLIMQERAHSIGASLSVQPARTRGSQGHPGTCVHLQVPLADTVP